MTEPPDLYRVLQVDPAAEPEVVRAAYVCLAKKYHPDAGHDAGERMVALNEAWAVLRDPAKRAAYDRSRPATRGTAGNAAFREPGDGTPLPRPPAGQHSGEARVDGVSTRLDFGRYAGWTLRELVHQDPDYLEWLARTPIGRQFHAEIADLLSTRLQGRAVDARQGRQAPPLTRQERQRERRLPRLGRRPGER